MSISKRQKFAPQHLVLLLRLAKYRFGKPISWQHLATQILLDVGIDEGDEGGFADTYLDKLYKESCKALERQELVGKDVRKIDTLAHYCGFTTYHDYSQRADRLFHFFLSALPEKPILLSASIEACDAFYSVQELGSPLPFKQIMPEQVPNLVNRHHLALLFWPEGEPLPVVDESWLLLINTKASADFDRERPVLADPYALEMAGIALDISLRMPRAEVAAQPVAEPPSPPQVKPSLNPEHLANLNYERPPLVDTYFIMARLLPTIFLCLPIVPLLLILMQKPDVIEPVAAWPEWLIWPLVAVILLLCVYGITLFLADHSKRLEKRYFKGRTGLPTTYLLSYNHQTPDGFSRQEKQRIRAKIEERFGLQLPSPEEEEADPQEAGRRLADAMLHVRQYMGKGHLIYKQSVRYGFNQVAIAGSWLGFFLSVATLVFSITLTWYIMITLSVVGMLLYGRWWLFPEKKYRQVAEDYARQLIMEFSHYG